MYIDVKFATCLIGKCQNIFESTPKKIHLQPSFCDAILIHVFSVDVNIIMLDFWTGLEWVLRTFRLAQVSELLCRK